MKSRLASFDYVRFENADEVLCIRCQGVLDRHQPDDEQPDRLLGTCPSCSSWFLIDVRSNRMCLLPEIGSGDGPD